ncbi:MAG: DNA polymerase III subunit delta [Firmicutes bacterium]|nr:DNA polymerase III subunit delta [Bacillota bacterium]
MNIYLVTSDSYKLIDAEVEKILQGSLNVVKYDLRVDSLIDVINEANYYSLTNEKKYIVVKSNNLFKATKKEESNEEDGFNKDIKLLEKYLANPSELSTIIFISYETPDKRRKVFKQIAEKGNAIILAPFNKKDLTYKCMEILKQKGYTANYDVANFIVENSYVNYDIMTNELEKIYVLLKPGLLTIEILKGIISTSLTSNVYSYINAIINRDLDLAFKSSKNFELLKIDPTMVLIMLAKEFQILYMIKNDVNLRELQNHLRKEDWQMNSYIANKDLYTLNELKKIIIKLNDYDFRVKSGLLDKSVMLDLLSLEFCE